MTEKFYKGMTYEGFLDILVARGCHINARLRGKPNEDGTFSASVDTGYMFRYKNGEVSWHYSSYNIITDQDGYQGVVLHIEEVS